MQLTLHRPQSFASAFRLAPSPVPAPRVHVAQARAQRSGGPDDRALYSCSCGFAFKAPVTTTVGCPQCGQAQAW
jgi:cytochrome c5